MVTSRGAAALKPSSPRGARGLSHPCGARSLHAAHGVRASHPSLHLPQVLRGRSARCVRASEITVSDHRASRPPRGTCAAWRRAQPAAPPAARAQLAGGAPAGARAAGAAGGTQIPAEFEPRRMTPPWMALCRPPLLTCATVLRPRAGTRGLRHLRVAIRAAWRAHKVAVRLSSRVSRVGRATFASALL